MEDLERQFIVLVASSELDIEPYTLTGTIEQLCILIRSVRNGSAIKLFGREPIFTVINNNGGVTIQILDDNSRTIRSFRSIFSAY